MHPRSGRKAVDVALLVNLLSEIGNLRLRIAEQEARAEHSFCHLFGYGLDLGMNHVVRSPVALVSGKGKELLVVKFALRPSTNSDSVGSVDHAASHARRGPTGDRLPEWQASQSK